MARVGVDATVPYLLMLPNGEYPIGDAGSLFLSSPAHRREDGTIPEVEGPFRTAVTSFFDASDMLEHKDALKVADREAQNLLNRVNRLLRWYRVLLARPDILEFTLPDISPFFFFLAETNVHWVIPSRSYERPELPAASQASMIPLGMEIREKLAKGCDPDPAQLTLLDAEQAMRVGRFRDAVLLSWSVIDSSVVQAFESLVDQKLTGEWGKSVDFLKGADFGLRHKMTSGLKLLCGRSLFEDKAAWQSLSEIYWKRNEIIHRNQKATAADARNAVQVARRVLSFLQELKP